MTWTRSRALSPQSTYNALCVGKKKRNSRKSGLLMNIVNLSEVFYLSVKARGLAYGERVLENLRSREDVEHRLDRQLNRYPAPLPSTT